MQRWFFILSLAGLVMAAPIFAFSTFQTLDAARQEKSSIHNILGDIRASLSRIEERLWEHCKK